MDLLKKMKCFFLFLGIFFCFQNLFSLAIKHLNISNSFDELTKLTSKFILRDDQKKKEEIKRKLKAFFGDLHIVNVDVEEKEVEKMAALIIEIKKVLDKKMNAFFGKKETLNFSFEEKEFKEIESFFLKIFKIKPIIILPLRKYFIKKLAFHLSFQIKNNDFLRNIAKSIIIQEDESVDNSKIDTSQQAFKTLEDFIHHILINPIFYPLRLPHHKKFNQEDSVRTIEKLMNLEKSSQTIVAYLLKFSEQKITPQNFLIADIGTAFLTLIDNIDESPSLLLRVLEYYDAFIQTFSSEKKERSCLIGNLNNIDQMNSIIEPFTHFLGIDFSLQYSNENKIIPRIENIFQNFSSHILQNCFFIRFYLINIFAANFISQSFKNISNAKNLFKKQMICIWKGFSFNETSSLDFIKECYTHSLTWYIIKKRKELLIEKLFDKYEKEKAYQMNYLLDIVLEIVKQTNAVKGYTLQSKINSIPWKEQCLYPLILEFEEDKATMEKFKRIFSEIFESKNFFLVKIFIKNFAYELGFTIKDSPSLMRVTQNCIADKENITTISDLIDLVLMNPLFYPISPDFKRKDLEHLERVYTQINAYLPKLSTDKMTPQKLTMPELIHLFSVLIDKGSQNNSLQIRTLKYYNELLKNFIPKNGSEPTGVKNLDKFEKITLLMSAIKPKHPQITSDFLKYWSHGFLKNFFFLRIHLIKTLAFSFLTTFHPEEIKNFIFENIDSILIDLNCDEKKSFNLIEECFMPCTPWHELEEKKKILTKEWFNTFEKEKVETLNYLIDTVFEISKRIRFKNNKDSISEAA